MKRKALILGSVPTFRLATQAGFKVPDTVVLSPSLAYPIGPAARSGRLPAGLVRRRPRDARARSRRTTIAFAGMGGAEQSAGERDSDTDTDQASRVELKCSDWLDEDTDERTEYPDNDHRVVVAVFYLPSR